VRTHENTLKITNYELKNKFSLFSRENFENIKRTNVLSLR